MPGTALGHAHIFVCKRSPQAHTWRLSCVERLVIVLVGLVVEGHDATEA